MSTTTTYTGIRIVDMPDLGAVTADSSVVGEHAGSGRFGMTALRAYFNDVINVMQPEYGARGDGVTDDAAAIQAAITAGMAHGRAIYIPGTLAYYRIGSTITVGGSVRIYGDGITSNLCQSGSSVTVFNVTTPDAVIFNDLAFGKVLTATQTAGTAITVDPGTGQHNGGTVVTNCTFRFQNTGLNFVRAYNFFVENCKFFYGMTDIVVQDLTHVDAGDSVITACDFAQVSSVNGVWQGAGIAQYSSGGLKIIGNKFLGHNFGYSFRSAYNGQGQTSQLHIVANNFDTVQQIPVVIQEGVVGEIFGDVFICDNLMINCNQAIETGPWLSSGANWLNGVVITGNQIAVNAGQGPAIYLQSGNNMLVDCNSIVSAGGTVTGLQTGASCTNVKIGAANQFVGCTTNIVPGGTGITVDPVFQTGSVTVTPSTTLGSLFQSAFSTIVFSPPFSAPPVVMCTASGGTGIGVRIGTTLATQTQLFGIAATSGSPMTIFWSAQGY